MVQLILDESSEILRSKENVIIARHKLGIVGAHAGIVNPILTMWMEKRHVIANGPTCRQKGYDPNFRENQDWRISE